MLNKTKFVRFLYVAVLVVSALFLVSPFFIPIVLAGTVALALFPIQARLENKGLSRKRAAALLTTVFSVIISIPLFFFLIKGTLLVTNQLEKISFNDKLRQEGVQEFVSDLRHDFVISIHKYVSKIEFLSFLTEDKIDSYLSTVNVFLLKFFRDFAGSIPLLFMLLLIMLLCVFSFLHHASGIKCFFQAMTGFDDDRMNLLTSIFIRDARQVYMSNIVTGAVQSLIVAGGVSLLGLGDFFFVFFITLILSFIPVIGAAPVSFVFAFIAFIKGNTTAAVILLVVGGFTGIIDNFLRPWLASFGESKVPPMVAFVCVIGGALLLGFPGLFIGLLVGSIAYDTIPLFWNSSETERGRINFDELG
jgi:predicted PurR-regulated permease PerM